MSTTSASNTTITAGFCHGALHYKKDITREGIRMHMPSHLPLRL